MNRDLVCEFIDVILTKVVSQKLDQSGAHEYLLNAILLASDQQKNLEAFVESVIRDIACA